MAQNQNVLVIIGAGGMGLAIARRLGGGRQLLISDKSSTQLQATVNSLRDDGYASEGFEVDVVDIDSVTKLAQKAAGMGRIDAIVHTAGVSPVMGTSRLIFEVDLLGTANVIEAFHAVASPGTSLVCVSSMSGYFATLSPDLESHLATASLDKLLQHPEIDLEAAHPGHAYSVAKRANVLRVQAASSQWGHKGARINSISPGVISTGMLRQEMEGPASEHIRQLVSLSSVGRIGSPNDIANVAAFLVSPESSYVNGSDLLVDGGVIAAQRWGKSAA
ncbi:hypothetical protein VTO42DRAFT_7145 [Malbranchea cinnamomea]